MPETRKRTAVLVSAAVVLALPASVALSTPAQAAHFGYTHLTKIQKRLVSGALSTALMPSRPTGGVSPRALAPGDAGELDMLPADPPPAGSYLSAAAGAGLGNYTPSASGACSVQLGFDVKVNQNCENVTDPVLQGRGQAQNETSVAVDPSAPNRLVASYNDYRRGDGNCYAAYSSDGGRTWADTTVPMGFTNGAAFVAPREYWQAGGDTSVAFDTRGNAYLSCQVFNRGPAAAPNPDQSSAFYVFRSTGNGGASWNFPGRPVIEHNDVAGAGNVLEDKQLLTVDAHRSSPFRDRVYVTWTEFAADGTAYIYESHSADYGETFSAPVLVSGTSALCSNTFGVATPQGTCNENQFSQPFTGADGALYVTFNNFNNTVTGNDNRNQVLLAKSTDGGVSFSAPVKVADYYDLPDCATYQAGKDAFRACVPEKGPTANSFFRATNYSVGSVDPRRPGTVAVTFGSYVNKSSDEATGCAPAGFSATTGQDLYTGVKGPGGCTNHILVSVSTDGGATFSGGTTDPRSLPVLGGARQRQGDQFWQWATFSPEGALVASYYDRSYGTDAWTGYSDVTVAATRDLTHVGATRATSSSMPPPTAFSGLFYGDYAGLDVGRAAYPVWADTRSPELFLCPGSGVPGVPPQLCTAGAANAPVANDEDAFMAAVGVPRS